MSDRKPFGWPTIPILGACLGFGYFLSFALINNADRVIAIRNSTDEISDRLTRIERVLGMAYGIRTNAVLIGNHLEFVGRNTQLTNGQVLRKSGPWMAKGAWRSTNSWTAIDPEPQPEPLVLEPLVVMVLGREQRSFTVEVATEEANKWLGNCSKYFNSALAHSYPRSSRMDKLPYKDILVVPANYDYDAVVKYVANMPLGYGK